MRVNPRSCHECICAATAAAAAAAADDDDDDDDNNDDDAEDDEEADAFLNFVSIISTSSKHFLPGLKNSSTFIGFWIGRKLAQTKKKKVGHSLNQISR